MGKPMTKERLRKYSSLRKYVNLLEFQLASTGHMASDSVRGSMPEFPYAPVSVRIYGYDEMVAQRLESRRRKLFKEREAIEDFLDTLDDYDVCRFITMHYVQGLTWLQIAMAEGGERSPDAIRICVNRFFEKNS